MANRVGSDAKSNSRLCFTIVKVTTPIAPRTVLPTKFAVAEKHMGGVLPCKNYSHLPRNANVSWDLGVGFAWTQLRVRIRQTYGKRVSRIQSSSAPPLTDLCQRKVEMSGFVPDRSVRLQGFLQG